METYMRVTREGRCFGRVLAWAVLEPVEIR